jgi:predicted enzyme related to lactoylglutathione lyase
LCGDRRSINYQEEKETMPHIIKSVVTVISVKNYEASVAWYSKLFKRQPDLVPIDGVAEWELVNNAWIQVAADSDRAGHASVVLVVDSIQKAHQECTDLALPISEVTEYPGVVRIAEIVDPEGNKVAFVEDISGG